VTWLEATVQTCVVHVVRNSLCYASKKHWSTIARQLRTIYTAQTVQAAEERFQEFSEEWKRCSTWSPPPAARTART
jgi:putative transposase